MSVNIYARQAPLSDACGRADYITSPNRQENLMATATTVFTPDFWQLLAADCQAAYRQAGGRRTNDDGTERKACEAREIHVQLPNSALERMQADQLAQKIANDFKAKYGVDCLVAIHYNKTKSNLHCHIMFSERQLLPKPDIKIAGRNVFLDANGIRKQTKKEIMDDDGQLLSGCSIVKKGEVLSARYFGNKNLEFEQKSWMDGYRHYMADWINVNLQPDELRTVFDKNGPYLAQRHIGNGTPDDKSRALKEWNSMVKMFNHAIDIGRLTPEEAKELKTRVSLSPDQNQELKAVMAELYREDYPDSEHREWWDHLAAQSAKTPLSPAVENRQEKQELRELYKAQGQERVAVVDAANDIDAVVHQAKVEKIGAKIETKKTNLGMTPEMQKVRELGRLAGVKREEINRLYQAAPKMTGAQWKQVWNGCHEATAQFWDEYRKRRDQLKDEINEAYKRRRKVKNAEWALDPRNRKKSLLGVLYAAVVLARNGHLEKWNDQIDRLKQEQTALRREVRKFKSETSKTYDTLHTKGLEPDAYMASVLQLQRMAEDVGRAQMQGIERREASRWRGLERDYE